MPFTPTDLPNCVLWLPWDTGIYEDDAGANPVEHTDDVHYWADASGQGNHALATANFPSYWSGGGLVYNSSNAKRLECGTVVTTNSFTWFVLYRSGPFNATADNYQALLGFGSSSDGADGGGFFIRKNDKKSALYIAKGAGSYDSYDGTGSTTYTAPDQLAIVHGVHTAGSTAAIYKNGTIDQSCSLSSGFNFSGSLGIGCCFTANRGHVDGVLAVVVYDRALSPGEQTQVLEYLATVKELATRYVMPSWSDETFGAMRQIASKDGRNWVSYGIAFSPSATSNGDYSLTKWNGTYWMSYSRTRVWLSNTPNFGVASSPDLKTWTEVATPDMSAGSPSYHCGGPEWVANKTGTPWIDSHGRPSAVFHGINSAGTATEFFESHPTNDSMTAWSTPQIITWTAKPTGTTFIDAFVQNRGGTFYMFYKQQTDAYIEYATSSSLLGPYTIQESGDWAGIGTSDAEGPAVLSSANIDRIYLDQIGASAGIGYIESTDGLATWSALTGITNDFTARHATVYDKLAADAVVPGTTRRGMNNRLLRPF